MTPVRDLQDNKENLNPAQPSAQRSSVAPCSSLARRSNFWPLTAWGYDWWRERSLSLLAGQPFPLPREARLFRSLCQPRPGDLWLDMGTSTGFYAGVLAQAGCRVLAADLSPVMLRQAARRQPSPQIQWRRLDAEQTGLPNATLDGVVIGATLNETADPQRLLREAARLIRPGGQVWLMYVPRTGGLRQGALARLGGLTFPDPAWVGQALAPLHRAHSLRVGAVQFERYLLGAGAG